MLWPSWLKFSPNGRIITTNASAHRLPLLSSTAPATDTSADRSYALAISDNWLTCDVENLILIPPQYRTEYEETSGQAVALGLSSGEVVVMSFNFSRGPPWEDMTSRSVPNPGAEEPLPDSPDDNSAPARVRQHRRAWCALKQFLKSPARNYD